MASYTPAVVTSNVVTEAIPIVATPTLTSVMSASEMVAIPVTSRLTAPNDSTFCEPVTLMFPSTNTSEKNEEVPTTDSLSPMNRLVVTVCSPTVATPMLASTISTKSIVASVISAVVIVEVPTVSSVMLATSTVRFVMMPVVILAIPVTTRLPVLTDSELIPVPPPPPPPPPDEPKVSVSKKPSLAVRIPTEAIPMSAEEVDRTPTVAMPTTSRF